MVPPRCVARRIPGGRAGVGVVARARRRGEGGGGAERALRVRGRARGGVWACGGWGRRGVSRGCSGSVGDGEAQRHEHTTRTSTSTPPPRTPRLAPNRPGPAQPGPSERAARRPAPGADQEALKEGTAGQDRPGWTQPAGLALPCPGPRRARACRSGAPYDAWLHTPPRAGGSRLGPARARRRPVRGGSLPERCG